MMPSLNELESELEKGSLNLSDLLFLRRHIQAPFRLHPLGFIACTLLTQGKYKLRLHCWPMSNSLQQSAHCLIHDHLFDFKSWILEGEVENIEYVAAAEGKDLAIYQTHYDHIQSVLIKTDEIMRISEDKRNIYNAGKSYSVKAGVLHQTLRISGNPAFTVLLTNEISSSPPKVLGPLDGKNEYRYSRSIVEEELVEKILSGGKI